MTELTNNENVVMEENMATENQAEETVAVVEEKTPFSLWLFIKVAAGLLLAYGLCMYVWDNFLRAWWMFQAPEWLKTGLFWFIWIDMSYVLYKQVVKAKKEIKEEK